MPSTSPTTRACSIRDAVSGRHPEHPVRRPVNFQTWRELTFLHFSYDVEAVQRLVPPELAVQHWDGQTWVALTPFRMADVRPPGLPPPPGWGAFPELNVRCYVRGPDGRDGIWFLGMVVPRLGFLVALRSIGLPYRLSSGEVQASDGIRHYRFGTPGWRRRRDDWFTATVQVGAPLAEHERTEVVDSLTGRWSAYHRRAAVVWRTPVQHEPWPLHRATVTGAVTAPLRWVGLGAPAAEPMVHAASTVHARLGRPRRSGVDRSGQ